MEYLIYIIYYIILYYIWGHHLKKTIILLLFLRLQHETGLFPLFVKIKLGLFVSKREREMNIGAKSK